MENNHQPVRRATLADLPFLIALEEASFGEQHRSSRRSIHHSLSSAGQEVYLIGEINPVGAIFLWFKGDTMRIYSVAVSPESRQQGAGRQLMNFVLELANRRRIPYSVLETDSEKTFLIDWYRSFGFEKMRDLENYYAPSKSAVKMRRQNFLDQELGSNRILIVADEDLSGNKHPLLHILSPSDFFQNLNESSSREKIILNLSSSLQYQSTGYYVSMLASARGQRVFPSVASLLDIHNREILKKISVEVRSLRLLPVTQILQSTFRVILGSTLESTYQKVADVVFRFFNIPVMSVTITTGDSGGIQSIQPLSLQNLTAEEKSLLEQSLSRSDGFLKKIPGYFVQPRYTLAILVNPQEKYPPSCSIVLNNFVEVAKKLHIKAEFITRDDISRLTAFDALFIRETTDLNNHTYVFSRLAWSEGLAVIDDPWSILRCSNKIYQTEIFQKNSIPMPQTRILVKGAEEEADISFPVIIKQPDSSFSVGVTKANNPEEYNEALHRIFIKSDLVVIQEFFYTPYDWRIGVLDNKVFYACKYFMSKEHWQVYDWSSSEEINYGSSEAVPLENVPPFVLHLAVQSSSLMGDGLYGVDIKQKGDQAFVIEVNENPNIDTGCEDKIGGVSFYETILKSFIKRIRAGKKEKRYLSSEPLRWPNV